MIEDSTSRLSRPLRAQISSTLGERDELAAIALLILATEPARPFGGRKETGISAPEGCG